MERVMYCTTSGPQETLTRGILKLNIRTTSVRVDLDLCETIKLWRPQKVNPLSEVFNKLIMAFIQRRLNVF